MVYRGVLRTEGLLGVKFIVLESCELSLIAAVFNMSVRRRALYAQHVVTAAVVVLE